jgi:hypothetical protein
VAHIEVSMLGKIFKTTFEPAKSAKVAIDKLDFTNLKSGAFEPTFGNSPFVFIGCPPNFIEAMNAVFRVSKVVKIIYNFACDFTVYNYY